MKPLKYSAIMPKIAIENLKLIETDDLVNLIGKELEVIRCALQESAYHDEVSTISSDKLCPILFEEVLLQNYVKTYKTLIEFSSGAIRNLLLAMLKKFEVTNIKTVLRTVKARMDIEEAIKHIIPVGTLNKQRCKAIMADSRDISDVINSLLAHEYGPIMKEAWDEKARNGDLLPLEVALNKAAYQSILESAKKLKGLDKSIALSVLGAEIDAVNFKIILRGKAKEISKHKVLDYLMPTVFIDKETLEEAMEAPDAKSAMERLLRATENTNVPFYKSAFGKIFRECNLQMSSIEKKLGSASLEISLNMLKKYTRYFNIGFILAFLNLKWFEIKNLICIIYGSKRRASNAQVRKLLVLPK